MKTFVVAFYYHFGGEHKLYQVRVDGGPYEAIKQAALSACTEKTYLNSEIEFQASERYPKTSESLIEYYDDADISVGVLEIE